MNRYMYLYIYIYSGRIVTEYETCNKLTTQKSRGTFTQRGTGRPCLWGAGRLQDAREYTRGRTAQSCYFQLREMRSPGNIVSV